MARLWGDAGVIVATARRARATGAPGAKGKGTHLGQYVAIGCPVPQLGRQGRKAGLCLLVPGDNMRKVYQFRSDQTIVL